MTARTPVTDSDTPSPVNHHSRSAERGAPLWRILLVILVGVCTFFEMAAALEVSARRIFPWRMDDHCLDGMAVARPYCVSDRVKLWEGPSLTYAYNDCGYRSAQPCSVVLPRERRVAVLGTSIANGYYVPYDDTFPARAGRALTRACGRPVDFQNLALAFTSDYDLPRWHHLRDRIPAALALHPTVVLVVLSAQDLSYFKKPLAAYEQPSRIAAPVANAGSLQWSRLLQRLNILLLSRSVVVAILRNVAFHDDATVVSNFGRSPAAGFLSPTFDSQWRLRLEIADQVLGPMEDRVRATGVPFIAVYVPNYTEALLARTPSLNPRMFPYALPKALQAIVERHGGRFVDLTAYFARQPKLYGDYYQSIDHPNSSGNAIIARGIVEALEADVPAFAACKASAQ